MLESAFGWIGQIVEWVGQFFPRLHILDTTEGAIKYVRGSRIKVCTPGLHFHWPLITKWVEYPTARQTDRLESQTMESRDGTTFIVSGMLTYEVVDLQALVTTTHDPMVTVVDFAQTAIHDVCCDMNWEALKDEQRRGTLNTKLRNAAQKQLGDYGVKVVKLMLKDLARARVIKISQSTSQEEN